MDVTPTYLDGNAASGPLAEVFSFDVSEAEGSCSGCAGVLVLSEGHLYAAGPGLVLRCDRCDQVLLRFASEGGRTWLDVRGLTYLEVRRRSTSA